jgi:hypothetical protein
VDGAPGDAGKLNMRGGVTEQGLEGLNEEAIWRSQVPAIPRFGRAALFLEIANGGNKVG